MKKSLYLAGLTTALILTACGNKTAEKDAKTESKPAAAEKTVSAMEATLAGKWRTEQSARDVYRHPAETLEFFGLTAGQSVLEISPGGGWYTGVLAPYLARTGGTYSAATYDESLGERYAKANERFNTKFSDNTIFGTINTVPFSATTGPLPAEQYDMVLTFRNIHNWMGRGYADKAFADFYAALKPGGVLGVVEHRLPESREQDPRAGSGYVQVSYTKALAAAAGFEFVGASEVNANPKDTADHPMGVWTLPPVSAKPKEGDERAEGFDADKYKAIGESDRFTLKFRKPE